MRQKRQENKYLDIAQSEDLEELKKNLIKELRRIDSDIFYHKNGQYY